MAEVLVPADDEVAAVDELNARMPVPMGTRIPRPRPAEFGRVVGTGGAARLGPIARRSRSRASPRQSPGPGASAPR